MNAEMLTARQAMARLNQARLESQLLTLDLLSGAELQQALEMIERWESRRLCSQIYCDKWRHILGVADRGAALLASNEWLNALLQNSPLLAVKTQSKRHATISIAAAKTRKVAEVHKPEAEPRIVVDPSRRSKTV